MRTSRAPAMQDGLKAVLDAAAASPSNALNGIPISLGLPGDAAEKYLYISERVLSTRSDDATGPGPTETEQSETVELVVVISVDMTAASYQDVRDEAWGLAAAVETAVYDNWTLDPAGTSGGNPACDDARILRVAASPTSPTETTRTLVLNVVVGARVML
jgi:hypothetical protein